MAGRPKNSVDETVNAQESIAEPKAPVTTDAPATGSTNAKTAVVYHIPYAAPRKLYVLKENEDGTLDIGFADGRLEVRRCPVAKEPTAGHVTMDLADLEIKDGDDKPEDKFEVIK